MTSEDSDSDCEREEDNHSQTKSEEISSLSFDSSPKESSTVYGFFQNLVGKFQNTDPSSYIEQAIEWCKQVSEASTDDAMISALVFNFIYFNVL